jgi:hypothetical protein
MIIMHWIIVLILDDHIVHDNTSIHDLPHMSCQEGYQIIENTVGANQMPAQHP